MSTFPSDEQFDFCVAANKRASGALNWKDLPPQVVYRVQPQSSVETKKGGDTLVELVNRENSEVKVWVPPSLANTLCYDKDVGSNQVPYIRSLGLQRKRPAVETVFLRDSRAPKKVKEEQSEQRLEKCKLLKAVDGMFQKMEVPEKELEVDKRKGNKRECKGCQRFMRADNLKKHEKICNRFLRKDLRGLSLVLATV